MKQKDKTMPPVIAPEKPLSKKFLFLSCILIITLGMMAYANSLNGKFLYDDSLLIEHNTFIKGPSALIDCFTKDIFADAGVGKMTNFYRPLQMASYALNYSVCKLDVRGYHLVNMLIHILVALSIYWLLHILFKNNFLSLTTALLFVVHPIQTEAVSYISGRCDPPSLLFMILSMIIYINLLKQDRFNPFGFILLLLTYACALFSKEHSIIFPVLLLFYHFVFGKRIKAIEFFSLLSIAIIYLVMRLIHLAPASPSLSTDTVFDRIPGFFVALFTYIKLLFLPFPLHMEYGQKLFGWADPRAIGGVLITLMIFILGYIKRNNKIILFSISWFFLSLLPVSNLYKINFYMAEHFLYIPSLGFFLLIAYAFNILYNDTRCKIVALVLTTCAVLFFLILTIKQNDYWKDPETFFKRTLEFAPDSGNSYNNLGLIYADEGKLTEALSNLNKAIELAPNDPNNDKAYNNRGNIYNNNGNYTKAISDFSKAIELNPTLAQAYSNRGSAYNKEGNYAQSILDLNKALELNSNSPESYNNLGNTYSSKSNYTDAILNYNKALELKPNYFEAYNNRGNVYNNKGEYAKAILDFNKAIELKSDYPLAYNNRGSAYNSNGNYAQALLDYNKAIELDPNLAQTYFSRGMFYCKKESYDLGLLDLNKAIELNPNYSEAYNNRGNIYDIKGNDTKAILDYSNAIKIDPNYAQAYFNRGSVYNSKGKYYQAVLDYNKALELNPTDAQAYNNRAIVYYNQKEFDKALADLHKAQELGAKIDPGFLEAVKKAVAIPTQ